MKRRTLLKSTLFIGAGLTVGRSLGAEAPDAPPLEFDPFQTESVQAALQALGVESAEASSLIRIRAASVAEDGKSVPIGVFSDLPGTTDLFLLVSTNPRPLAARYRFSARCTPSVESRLKIAQTTDLIAVAIADGRHYLAKKQIKVTQGGCGG